MKTIFKEENEMDETYNLELSFESEYGGSKKITIRRPEENLTEAEVQPVMQTIVDSGLFTDGLDLKYSKVKSARYVRTTVEDILEG